jgi:carboxymethylenebutenolidase
MARLEPERAISRTTGHERVVDEFMIKFTRTLQMDWLLPGVPAADKLVEVATVTGSPVQNGKIASERIYSDQASVPVQLGLNVSGFALI